MIGATLLAIVVILHSLSSNKMHRMALQFVVHVAQTNSYPTIPSNWLHKTARAREAGYDGVGKFNIASL